MRAFSFVALIFSTLILLSSCEAKFDWPWLKKNNPSQESLPPGQAATVDRAIGAFDRVRLDGVGKLIFDDAIPQGILRIRADENALSAIQTTVDQSLLQIREEGIRGPDSWDIEFRVAPPNQLIEINLSGMGAIESTSALKTLGKLSVVLQGVGKIDVAVDAPAVVIHQQGSGELVVRGKAGSVNVEAQGLGKVDASELITGTAEVQSQGVGEVVVYASEKLKVRAQGLGAVRFKGTPAQTDVQTEGLTKVSPAD